MIYISLTVHESPEFLIHQLNNIDVMYEKNYKVVLHISKNSSNFLDHFNSLIHLLRNKGAIVINTDRCETMWCYILQAHISNFNFVKNENFDKFILMASNELILRKNISDHIKKYDFGVDSGKIIKNNGWVWTNTILQDAALHQIINDNSIELFCSYHEGSFYSKDIMKKNVEIYAEYNDWFGLKYPREEVFFPSVTNSKFTNLNKSNILTMVKLPHEININLIKDINNGSYENIFNLKGFQRNPNNQFITHLKSIGCL